VVVRGTSEIQHSNKNLKQPLKKLCNLSSNNTLPIISQQQELTQGKDILIEEEGNHEQNGEE